MRIIGRIFDVLALICAAILPACSPTDRGKDNGKPYVAFVSNNAEEFWTYARRGTEAAAKEFKVFFAKVPGKSPGSYTMDHSAASFVFDPAGRVRLYVPYGGDSKKFAADLQQLVKAG